MTDRLYLRIPDSKITLMSVGVGDVQSMKLSIDDAKQIFRSIKRACDLREVVEIKVGDLSWKTDARIQSNPDIMIIAFRRLLEHTRTTAKRDEVEAAVADFANRFGLD